LLGFSSGESLFFDAKKIFLVSLNKKHYFMYDKRVMKICFIADGGSDHTQAIANYFASSNHEVYIVSPRFRKGYDQRIHLYHLDIYLPRLGKISTFFSYVIWIYKVKTAVKSIKPDLVNAHFITVYGLLTLITDFHPLVVTAWGSDVLIQPRQNPLWRFIIRCVLRKSDLFTCLFDVDMLKNDIGKLIPKSLDTASIPHGIDTSLFRKDINTTDLRQKYRINSCDPVIINIRGLLPIFDPDTFLKAVPLVIKTFPQAWFLMPCQNEYRDPYIKLIEDLQIEKNVIILDWLTPQEVAQHLAIADIYVSTSLSDGASNALFEGMACELAPVVTDIPANRCWIKDGENGFLFKPKDYNTLAEKIIRLIKDKEKRKLFGKKCREIIIQKAEFKTQMAKTEEIYLKLIERHSK
jgi:L-malate glycosyltransferase